MKKYKIKSILENNGNTTHIVFEKEKSEIPFSYKIILTIFLFWCIDIKKVFCGEWKQLNKFEEINTAIEFIAIRIKREILENYNPPRERKKVIYSITEI